MKQILLMVIGFIGFDCFAVPVFRFPDSPITSGDFLLKTLKPSGKSAQRTWVKVKWQTSKKEDQDGWVLRNSVIRDIDVSQKLEAIEDNQYRYLPEPLSAPKGVIEKGSLLLVKMPLQGTRKDGFVLVEVNGRNVWAEEKYFRPYHLDPGYLIPKGIIKLRKYPTQESSTIASIQPNIKLKSMGITKEWMKVKLEEPFKHSKTGWVLCKEVFSKFDFATQVKTTFSGGWMDITSYKDARLELENKKTLALREVKAIQTDGDIAFARGPKVQVLEDIAKPGVATKSILDPNTRASAVAFENVTWAQGTKNFGTKNSRAISLWWPSNQVFASSDTKKTYFTTAQVYKNQIFDMASHPQNPNVVYVSGRGIYRTFDGKKWEKLQKFGNENHPLAISKSGAVYVGPNVSFDDGKTFSPFIRWEKLINLYWEQTKKMPIGLKLTQIKLKSETDQEEIILGISSRNAPANQLSEVLLKSINGGRGWTVEGSDKLKQDLPLPRPGVFPKPSGLELSPKTVQEKAASKIGLLQ